MEQSHCCRPELHDQGSHPAVLNMEQLAARNRNFRIAVWTGTYLQITLMSLHPGEDIGQEMHPNLDQLLRVEHGSGTIRMSEHRDEPGRARMVHPGDVIVIPAGTWHNLLNSGRTMLQLSSIYAPPPHPFGTVQPERGEAH